MHKKIAVFAVVQFAVGLGLGFADAFTSGVAVSANAAGVAVEGDAKKVSKGCASFYPQNWRPVEGQDMQLPTVTPKPVKGKPFMDAAYKTCVVRITDHAAEQVPGFARNDYSRRQAFNADDSKIVVTAQDGSWHLYDARTYQHIAKLPGLAADAEAQWHPTDPNLLYYFPAFGIGMQIVELNIKTGQSRIAAELASRIKAIWPTAQSAWTKSEGSPSADARYWGLMVDDANWKGLGMVTYDLVADRIINSYDFAKNRKDRPDHVSMSPSGSYIVASWGDGTWSFSRDFSTARKVHHTTEHSDLAVDANEDDTYVSIDYQSRGGEVFMINLRTGARTGLFPTYLQHTATAIHFSGKAFRKPGWVLMSTYADGGGSRQWMHRKVFAVELKNSPRIINIAHHHVVDAKYWTEPHATVNRDFTRILFNSNWGVKSETDVDTYLVELPIDVIPARH
jgi:hypothetical protein